jgi:hypothetical protein
LTLASTLNLLFGKERWWAMGRQDSAGKRGLASGGQRQTRRKGPPTVAGAFGRQGRDREMEGKLKTAGRRRRRKAA